MDREVEVEGRARLVVRGVADDGTVESVDIKLIKESGARWSATVLTLAEVGRLMSRHRRTGEGRG